MQNGPLCYKGVPPTKNPKVAEVDLGGARAWWENGPVLHGGFYAGMGAAKERIFLGRVRPEATSREPASGLQVWSEVAGSSLDVQRSNEALAGGSLSIDGTWSADPFVSAAGGEPITVRGVEGYVERLRIEAGSNVDQNHVVWSVPAAGGGYAVWRARADMHRVSEQQQLAWVNSLKE